MIESRLTRGPRASRSLLRSAAKGGLLRVAKMGFAAADLFLGPWPGPRILIYHQIGSGVGGQMDVPTGTFQSQLEWLDATGSFARLEDVVTGQGADGSRTWALTFDDGYEDVYRNAFPMLRERSIPFALYLTTANIETGEPFPSGATPLGWGQIEEMVDTGLVTLGAHTHTHPDLRELSPADIEEELDTSNDLISRRLGQSPRHFAYPKGYWAEHAEGPVRARYDTAVLGAGPPVTVETDPLRLSRLPVQRADGYFFFRRKVVKGMRLEEALRRRVKGYDAPVGGRIEKTS